MNRPQISQVIHQDVCVVWLCILFISATPYGLYLSFEKTCALLPPHWIRS